MLTNRLYGMTMREGEDINIYLTNTVDLRNQLKCYGEVIEDKTSINLVLNGLPQSYEMIIQGITYLTNPTFDIVMEKLLTETHRKNLRDQKRGQDEALSVQYQQHRHGGGGAQGGGYGALLRGRTRVSERDYSTGRGEGLRTTSP